jgi:hypothetical protein
MGTLLDFSLSMNLNRMFSRSGTIFN